jgi:hypothetical protein
MANNLDAFIPEIWSKNIIANIDQVNVAKGILANTSYEGEIRQYGDTVHVRTFGNVTLQDYQRGGRLAPQDMVPTKEALTIDTAKSWTIDLDDLDAAQNDINALQGYAARAGVACAEAIDTYLFSFVTSAPSANRVNSGSAVDVSTGTAATNVYDLAVEAGRLLDNQSVPQTGRWLVVTPYVKALLLRNTTYLVRASAMGDAVVRSGSLPSGANMTASQAMNNGYVGQLAGMDVWCSTNLPMSGANYYLPFGQGKPVSYAAQIPISTIKVQDLQDTHAVRIKGLFLHGAKVFAEDSKRLGYILADNS